MPVVLKSTEPKSVGAGRISDESDVPIEGEKVKLWMLFIGASRDGSTSYDKWLPNDKFSLYRSFQAVIFT